MRRLYRKFYVSLLIFILTFISSVLVMYAFFVTQDTRGILIETSEYEIEIVATFSGEVVSYVSPYYDIERAVIIVNAYDETAENYIGNLDVKLYITPYNASRVRMRLFDEWELTRTYLDQDPLYPIDPVIEALNHPNMGAGYYPFSTLTVSPTFSPIFSEDGYAYFDEVFLQNETVIIDFITGGDAYPARANEVFEETVYVYLDIRIEIVQANRFSEIWGIDPNFFTP